MDAWERIKQQIAGRLSSAAFDNWVSRTTFAGEDGTGLRVSVPDEVTRQWMQQEYAGEVWTAIHELGLSYPQVVYEIGSPQPLNALLAKGAAEAPVITFSPAMTLNPRFTFDNFVVGSCNQFAHAAARAVATVPARTYNPLFIYGGVGLGKTHLLNAIGNHLAERSDMRIAYVTTEQFTNEVINSIRYDKMIDLRKRYRNIDMLLVDDVQFLAGKERTQEEFFHTFNTLYEAQKQIVLSSDRFPKEMPDMEERLRSRFEWGLIADLQPPDVETRIAILRKKSDDERIALPEEVIQFLATTMKSNIRELEGSLVRLGAYSSLTGQPITMDMAKNVLRDIIGDKKKVVTMDDIEEAVAERFHVKISEMKSRRRSKTLVHPRQIAMYLCRELTNASFPEIGRHFGGKDHTTIIHACKQIAKAKETDMTLKTTLDTLKEHITKG